MEINQIHKIYEFNKNLITVNVVLSDNIHFLVRIWMKEAQDFYREICIHSQSCPAVTFSRRLMMICAGTDVLFYDLMLLNSTSLRTEAMSSKYKSFLNIIL